MTTREAPSRGLRQDIQALRAIAVALVVVFHFWPSSLTGGYVGVDVFFVISGFLITSHLLQRPPTSVRDLAAFWGRRIRRLLPAAFTVLLTTLAATWWLAPASMWAATAKQAVASALYVQNWVLAEESVDYLAADNVATPVQHYWSLSIEEQFYLGWPVLVLVAALVARRSGRSVRACAGVAVTVVLGVSLVWSVLGRDDAASYFVTWTRIWELGVGGLVAVVLPLLGGLGRTVRIVAVWSGLAMMAVAAVTYDGATAFPGFAALLPVLGAALVIAAAVPRGPLSPLRVMGLRPVQALGDVSYAVYLWHWPVVVLLPFALESEPTTWQLVVALAVVLLLSQLTKVLVEDPLRGQRPLGLPLRRSFVFALVGALLVTGGAVALRDQAQEAVRPPGSADRDDPCFGARAVTNECDLDGQELATSTVFASEDNKAVRDRNCMSSTTGLLADPACHYGSDDPGALKVAMVGNSHGAHWLPVFRAIARQRGWSLTTYFAFECHTSDRPVAFPEKVQTDNCETFNQRAISEVADQDFDLVVLANRTLIPLVGLDGDDQEDENQRETEASYRRIITTWRDAGSRVLVMRDNPRRHEKETVPQCIDLHPDDLAACDRPLAEADVWDPEGDVATEMARTDDGVGVFDLRPWLCPDDICRAVVGGVITLWDTHHLTATFVRSLRPQVATAVDELLGPG
ncbi:acyltransferase family protein [Nocardioides lianchengensis]|uniref:Peptidoglycan/LPS O-acetylase OafA/YrhL, contains acyltransferase and SGNH-hydrolase domains n=1 Tax=Nocardioides lianchengensis TaxID=1045774 RepID=A0A1G6ZB62_9ACTN|nr:acyltransferase family protein [Nocardioides lianchengensis]NYG11467.1 peptidoglycan/LPS O-acetylase OafA/YrhL [Nocardioides lianchengensis]SDD99257.1 Peptidoglycan/LPS O-acetylase OafA/YrhL, contains acyltransferase and SGNH-hydrolase domains [Nocardioides lianchengensis]